MKKKNIILAIVVLLTEAYFFYRSGFIFSENFFLIFAVIFGVFLHLDLLEAVQALGE